MSAQQVVRQIMASRVEKAASMSCDGIEPDNMSVRKQMWTNEFTIDWVAAKQALQVA